MQRKLAPLATKSGMSGGTKWSPGRDTGWVRGKASGAHTAIFLKVDDFRADGRSRFMGLRNVATTDPVQTRAAPFTS